MEETREQQKLHGFMQCGIYVSILLEAAVFIYPNTPFWGVFIVPLHKIGHMALYGRLLYSKLATFGLICLVSIGTLAKKETELDPKKQVVYPLVLGMFLFFGCLVFQGRASPVALPYTNWYDLAYLGCSFIGAVLISISMDNISKMIRSGLGKDKWNTEAESFMQPVKKKTRRTRLISRCSFIMIARSVMAGSISAMYSGVPWLSEPRGRVRVFR